MYFGPLTMVMVWFMIAPPLIIHVDVSVNGEEQQRESVMRYGNEYDEDDDVIDDDGNEEEDEEQSSISPRTTMEHMGIYGRCQETLDTFTVVASQGACVLVYDPHWNPYGCSSVAMLSSGCEKENEEGTCIGNYTHNWCFEVAPGWYWFWGTVKMSRTQNYKYFRQNTQVMFYRTKVKNEGGFPFMPQKVKATTYYGRIKVHITPPEFKEVGIPRQALGYRVSVLDMGLKHGWDIQTNLEAVVYRCEFPEARPIHPCPTYSKDKAFCVLVTEPVFWTNFKADTGMKYIRVETYFLPQFQENRWYSQPFIVLPEVAKSVTQEGGPMFGYGNESYTRKPPSSALTYGYPLMVFWILLCTLVIFALIAGIPLICYLSARAGQRDADATWRAWADSPGNLAVGLGSDAVAWYGKPPWSLRPKTTKA